MSRSLVLATFSSLVFHILLVLILNVTIRIPEIRIPPDRPIRVGLAAEAQEPVSGRTAETQPVNQPVADVQPDDSPAENSPDPALDSTPAQETFQDLPLPAQAVAPTELSQAIVGDYTREEGTGETGDPLPEESSESMYGLYGNSISLDEQSLSGARMAPPEYPAAARRLGWEGDIVLVFSIDEKGRTANIRILETSGYEILDETAVRTVERAWRFPKGAPLESVWKTFSFRLE